jgi:hypothetical protein
MSLNVYGCSPAHSPIGDVAAISAKLLLLVGGEPNKDQNRESVMRKFMIASVMIAVSAAAFAEGNPWVGTWKLDAARSHFIGDTFSYAAAKDGKLHYSDGSTNSYDFGLDGKDYPAAYGRTTSWTASGDHVWDSVTKANGALLWKVHRVLSADGKTLTLTATGARPDGSKFNDITSYTRVSGSKGLVGTWRSTKTEVSLADVYIITAPSATALHWEFPMDKSSVAAKGPGVDTPLLGPNIPATLTFNYKMDSARKLSYVVKFQGRPDTFGVQTLAADGKSFTDTYWSPGKETEKATALYVRQ